MRKAKGQWVSAASSIIYRRKVTFGNRSLQHERELFTAGIRELANIIPLTNYLENKMSC